MKIGDKVKVVRILDDDELTEEMHLGRRGVIVDQSPPSTLLVWGVEDANEPGRVYRFAGEELEVIND